MFNLTAELCNVAFGGGPSVPICRGSISTCRIFSGSKGFLTIFCASFRPETNGHSKT